MRNNIGHQALITTQAFTCHYQRILHGWMSTKHDANFSQFNPIPPYFYLVITTLNKLYISIMPIASNIASFIQSGSWLLGKWMGNKAFSRYVRQFKVSSGKPFTAQVEIATH